MSKAHPEAAAEVMVAPLDDPALALAEVTGIHQGRSGEVASKVAIEQPSA